MTRRMKRKAIAAGVLLALAASAPAPAQDFASVTLAKDTVGTPAERAALMLAHLEARDLQRKPGLKALHLERHLDVVQV